MTPADRASWVIALDLDVYAKALLFALAHRADGNTGEAWPSMERLARESGMSIRKARAVTRELCTLGLVEVRCSAGKATNRYVVNFGVKPAHGPEMNRLEPGAACRVLRLQPGTARHLTRHHTSSNPAQRADRTGNRTGKEQGASSTLSVWDIGAGILGSRNLLGKLIRDHGEEAVGQAITSTDLKRPADSKSYLLGILKSKTQPEVPRVSNDW